MALNYSTDYEGSIVSTTVSATTITALVDGIKTAMVSAGWSATGATGDWSLTSGASHPNGFTVTVRVWNPSDGSVSARLAIKAPPNLTSSNGVRYLFPNSETYRVIASPYHVWIYSQSSSAARRTAGVFVPATPDAIEGSPVGTQNAALLMGSGGSDGSTSVVNTFRDNFQGGDGQLVLGADSYGVSNDNSIWSLNILYLSGAVQYRGAQNWADGSIVTFTPMLAMRINTGGMKIGGYLFDAFIACTDSPAVGAVWSYDGKIFRCIGLLTTLQSLWLRDS